MVREILTIFETRLLLLDLVRSNKNNQKIVRMARVYRRIDQKSLAELRESFPSECRLFDMVCLELCRKYSSLLAS